MRGMVGPRISSAQGPPCQTVPGCGTAPMPMTSASEASECQVRDTPTPFFTQGCARREKSGRPGLGAEFWRSVLRRTADIITGTPLFLAHPSARSDIESSWTRRSRAGYRLRFCGPIPGNGREKEPLFPGVESSAIAQNWDAGSTAQEHHSGTSPRIAPQSRRRRRQDFLFRQKKIGGPSSYSRRKSGPSATLGATLGDEPSAKEIPK
jgi:hypothetical protein